MKYLIHVEGEGEGCDYTIGCNHRLDTIEADSIDEAVQKWLDTEIEKDDEYYIPEYGAIRIYEVNRGEDIDWNRVTQVYRDFNKGYEKEKRRAELKRELDAL